MRPHFLAFRRTLPGGMIVLVSLAIDKEGVVHGMLQVERRLDPSRQLFDTAPVVARASGKSKDDVLKKLYYGNALRLTPGLSHAGFTS